MFELWPRLSAVVMRMQFHGRLWPRIGRAVPLTGGPSYVGRSHAGPYGAQMEPHLPLSICSTSTALPPTELPAAICSASASRAPL